MKPSGPTPVPSAGPNNSVDDSDTSLPVFKTWPAVYAFVFVAFVVCVLLLTALARAFP